MLRARPSNAIRWSSRTKFENISVDAINTLGLLFVCVITLYPFLNVLAISLNEATDSIRGGITLYPRMFSLRNYEVVLLETPTIPQAMINSALRAIIGTALSIPCSMMLAFVLSRKDYVLRKAIAKTLLLTMYISGGLIPTFLSYRMLGLMNNFLVYILPGTISAFNVLVMRSYLEGIPFEITESAKIDGASEFRILFSILFPLSLPVIATIGLFVSVGQWNSWFDTMLYCSSKPHLSTLQFELKKILDSAQTMTGDTVTMEATASAMNRAVTPTSLRAAMTIIAIAPIILIYPFVQRYFVTGLTLGGVKG